MEHARTLEVRIEPAHVDELRAGAVRLGGDLAHDLLLAGFAGDRDHLAGLDVRAEAYGEGRKALQVRTHVALKIVRGRPRWVLGRPEPAGWRAARPATLCL